MDIFHLIAERKIREALEAGLFDDLPKGKTLDLDSDIQVPEDIRMAYRVLKNAGYVPLELELTEEIRSLRSLIGTLDDDAQRTKRIRELNFKILRLNEMRKRPFYLEDYPDYEDKIIDRFIG